MTRCFGLFPLTRFQPAIIHWEIKHLSAREKEDCLQPLSIHGHRFAWSGGEDMLAISVQK
jgi:hypothetical protein